MQWGSWGIEQDARRHTNKAGAKPSAEKRQGLAAKPEDGQTCMSRARAVTELGLQLLTVCGRYSLLSAKIVFEARFCAIAEGNRRGRRMAYGLLRRSEQNSRCKL